MGEKSTSVGREMQGSQSLRLHDLVEVKNLRSEIGQSLNGRRGSVERRPDGDRSARVEVLIGDRLLRLKQENLELVAESLRLGPLSLRLNDFCEVIGLTSAAGSQLNGSLVSIAGWDEAAGRYRADVVSVKAEASKALLPKNLVPVAEKELLDMQECLEALQIFREWLSSEANIVELRRARGSGNQNLQQAVVEAFLGAQLPVLQKLGFRPDRAGRGQLQASLLSFAFDEAFCSELASPLAAALPSQDQLDHSFTRPAVFLDIDGVLHSLLLDEVFRGGCCCLLERLLRCSRAEVVLSSTWRLEPDKVETINTMFKARGLPLISEMTKDLGCSRAEEICEWLDRHPTTQSWIVLDDLDLTSRAAPSNVRLRGHCVRTDSWRGLQVEDIELALLLLAAQRTEEAALDVLKSYASCERFVEGLAPALDAPAVDEARLRALFQACTASGDTKTSQVPSLESLLEKLGIPKQLFHALDQAQLGNTQSFAEVSAPVDFERRVLRLWFDPADGDGERSLLPEEKDSLKQLYERCREEVGLPPGPYSAKMASKAGPRTLREYCEHVGLEPALRERVLEHLCALAPEKLKK